MTKAPSLLLVAALLVLAAPSPAALAAAPKPPKPHVCGAPAASGELKEPPQVRMASQPKDDRGRPELILRVARDGDRFCYRYTLEGVAENVPPVIRVTRGEQFDLRVVNEISGPAAGATMTASALAPCKPAPPMTGPVQTFSGYMNHMTRSSFMPMNDMDVNMHFHGFQGAAADEAIFDSTLSTSAHACEYHITIPATQPVGTYFYHPHAHGAAGDQVGGGLGGAWIVDPATPEVPSADDHVISFQYRIPFLPDTAPMVDDAVLFRSAARHEASIKAAPSVAFDPFNPPAWPSDLPLRSGDVSLHAPLCGDRAGGMPAIDGIDAPATLTVPANEPQLLRLLNATSDSIYRLHLRDSRGTVQPIDIVARDGVAVGGNGAKPLAAYEVSRETMLVPAQRADMLLTLKPGETMTLFTDRHCNGPFDEEQINRNLLVIKAGAPAPSPATIVSKEITPSQSGAMDLIEYAKAHAAQVRKRAFTYTEYLFPRATGKRIYGTYNITETDVPDFHEQPFRAQYAAGSNVPEPDVVVKAGTVEEWNLYNATLETHSFHIHQMDFVALDGADAPQTLDTVVMPVGTVLPNPKNRDYPLIKPSLTRVLLDFRHVPRGTFVFHCHMLFHEDRGMMKVIKVE